LSVFVVSLYVSVIVVDGRWLGIWEHCIGTCKYQRMQ